MFGDLRKVSKCSTIFEWFINRSWIWCCPRTLSSASKISSWIFLFSLLRPSVRFRIVSGHAWIWFLRKVWLQVFTKLHRVIRASFRIVWFASWQNTNTCSNILCWKTVSAPHYESTATLESAHNASIIIASLRFKSPTSKFNKPFKTNTLVNDDYPQVQKFASIPSTVKCTSISVPWCNAISFVSILSEAKSTSVSSTADFVITLRACIKSLEKSGIGSWTIILTSKTLRICT